MNYPLLIEFSIDDDNNITESAVAVLSNCTSCAITETDTDFTASLTLTSTWGNEYAPTPYIRDIVRIQHVDGNEYDFKVTEFSYSGGTYSVTAKYLAYDLAGILNEPMVGMFTPKGMVDYLNDHLHGYSVSSSVSCDADDRYFGVACISPQMLRTTLYSQLIGSTGYHLIPYNGRNLKLVKSRGKDYYTYLSTNTDLTDFSYSLKVPDEPESVVGYVKNDDGSYEYGNSSLISPLCAGEASAYDATSDSENSEFEYLLTPLYALCEKKLEDSKQDYYATESGTVTANLSKEAPKLHVGDRVAFIDDQSGVQGVIGDYESRVIQLEYDSLNDMVTSVTVGNFNETISDLIAEQSNTIESYGYLDANEVTIETDEWDENNECTFVVQHYNEGDVVSVEWEEGDYNGDTYLDPRISNIDGNVFTVKVDEAPENDFVLFWWLRYIQRTEHSLYDAGDLCDLTWTNYSTSYLSFDTAQISLKSGGAPRACTNETISLTGYKRLVIEYELTTYKDTYVGLNTTVSTSAAVPDAFYCKLAKGGTKASVEIPDDYLESDELYLKIYGKSGVVGNITKIYLQSN